MANNNYSKIIGKNLPISTKQAIEILNSIRNKNIAKVKKFLQRVIDKKTPVEYKRFNRDTGHKPGMAAGRYPVKSSKHILQLINSLEANAEFKGMDKEKLIISYAVANKGNTQFHPGRIRGRQFKTTHIELRAMEK